MQLLAKQTKPWNSRFISDRLCVFTEWNQTDPGESEHLPYLPRISPASFFLFKRRMCLNIIAEIVLKMHIVRQRDEEMRRILFYYDQTSRSFFPPPKLAEVTVTYNLTLINSVPVSV